MACGLCAAASSWAVATAPVNGVSVSLQPRKGTVTTMAPGQPTATPLTEAQTVPVGTIVDATHGRVFLTSANPGGKRQSAVFFGGRFKVLQQRGESLVVLELRGGDFSLCPGHGKGGKRPGATASGKKAGGRRLWGDGKGNFRSKGNFGAATVRGTVWFTEDHCSGTFFKVRRGVVSVRDYPASRTLSLTPGKGHWARAK
jgi:hypothetical protein